MKLVFEHTFAASREALFAFHERPGNLALLNRRWPAIRLGAHEGIVRPGGRTAVAIRLGPVWVGLTLEHFVHEPPLRFGETQARGPFRRFRHVHEFEVETYLQHQGRRFVERFDANTYLYMTKAMDYFDLRGDARTLADALRDVRARFLVMSFSSDWLFPTAVSLELVTALQQVDVEVAYAEIPSRYGHDAFLLEPEAQHRLIAPFLARVAQEAGA